jgi:hypothetical protein
MSDLNSVVTMTPALEFEWLDEDGAWFVKDERFPGCWGLGNTKDSAADDFVSALRDWFLISRRTPEADER